MQLWRSTMMRASVLRQAGVACCLVSLLAGCGGGGGGGGSAISPTEIDTPPQLKVHFPKTGYFTGDAVTIQGSFSDDHSNDIEIAVQYDGATLPLVVDAENARFRGSLALNDLDTHDLTIEATDAITGEKSSTRLALRNRLAPIGQVTTSVSTSDGVFFVVIESSALAFSNGSFDISLMRLSDGSAEPVLTLDSPPLDLVFDEARNRILLLMVDSILAYELTSGSLVEVYASNEFIAGPGPTASMVLDAVNDRLFILQSSTPTAFVSGVLPFPVNEPQKVLVFDLVTLQLNNFQEAGPGAIDIAYDPGGNYLYIVDGLGIERIDAVNGTRVRMATNSLPEGPLGITQLAFDHGTDTLLAFSAINSEVIRFESAALDYKVVASSGSGAGWVPVNIVDMDMGRTQQSVIVSSSLFDVPVLIDLVSGDRSAINSDVALRDYVDAAVLDGVLYASDNATSSIVAIDAENWQASELATGITSLGRLSDVPGSDALLYLHGGTFTQKTKVSSIDVGSGVTSDHFEVPLFSADFGAISDLDALGNAEVFLASGCQGRGMILRMDLAATDVSVLSGVQSQVPGAGERGEGPPLNCPIGITSGDSGNLYVSNTLPNTIYEIDIQSGDRSVVSGCTPGDGGCVGDGPDLGSIYGLEFDPQTGTLFGFSSSISRADSDAGSVVLGSLIIERWLLAVDAQTGARSIVSGSNRGAGPFPGFVLNLPITYLAQEDTFVLAAPFTGGLLLVDRESGDRVLPDITYNE